MDLAGVDLLFLFVCYFAYFLRFGILPTGPANVFSVGMQ